MIYAFYNLKETAVVAASESRAWPRHCRGIIKRGGNVCHFWKKRGEIKTIFSTELEGKGQVAYLQADITKPNYIKALIRGAVERFGGIDILLNNAGGPPAGSFETLTDEDWQNSFELNLLSYIRVIREALPFLKENGGKIINIASSSIKEPIPGLILSNTFRTGIVGLTKTLAQELAPYHILINTVAPGRIATDRVKHLDDVNAKQQSVTREEVEEKAKKSIPLKRYGTPEEFAKTVVFLSSEANSYMTGSSFLVDGGMVKSI